MSSFLIDGPPGTAPYTAGVDLADVYRLERALARSGPRLLARLFDPAERAACADGADRPTAAALFGMKESVVKVAGGLPAGGRYRDIHVAGADGTFAVTLDGELGRWARTHGVAVVAGTAPMREGPVLSWAMSFLEDTC